MMQRNLAIIKIINFTRKFLLQYVASRRHMASQCMDEAENSCLKLRFRNDAGKKCRPSEVDVINNFSEKDIAKRRTYGNVIVTTSKIIFQFGK